MYAWNYFDRRHRSPGARFLTDLGAQSPMGLLPEWRVGFDPFDPPPAGADGTYLGGCICWRLLPLRGGE